MTKAALRLGRWENRLDPRRPLGRSAQRARSWPAEREASVLALGWAVLINDWYRTDLDSARLVDYTQRTFAPNLSNHPDVLALLADSGVAGNVRRSPQAVLRRAGLDADDWTPRELRHSFVSLMSSSGMRIEDIADLVGHAGTRVTETVYRHQLRRSVSEGGFEHVQRRWRTGPAPPPNWSGWLANRHWGRSGYSWTNWRPTSGRRSWAAPRSSPPDPAGAPGA